MHGGHLDLRQTSSTLFGNEWSKPRSVAWAGVKRRTWSHGEGSGQLRGGHEEHGPGED